MTIACDAGLALATLGLVALEWLALGDRGSRFPGSMLAVTQLLFGVLILRSLFGLLGLPGAGFLWILAAPCWIGSLMGTAWIARRIGDPRGAFLSLFVWVFNSLAAAMLILVHALLRYLLTTGAV